MNQINQINQINTIKTLWIAPAVIVLLVAIAWNSPTGQAKGAGEKSALKVGTVDINLIFKKYKKTIASEKKINDAYQLQRQEFKALAASIKRHRDELGLIASGSTLLAQKRQALFMEERRYKFRTKWAEAEFRERLHLATQKLYNEIQQWIAKYAEKQGYDLILKIDRRPLAAKTQEEMKLKIHTRTVIYQRKALDLTDHVIKLLNQ